MRQSAFATFWRTPLAKWPAALWAVLFALQKAYELEGVKTKMDVTLESLLAMGEEMHKQVIASASPEERLAELSAEEIEQLLTNNEQLCREVVAHVRPEERLAGLGPEELLVLLKQIEAYLHGEQAAPDTSASDSNPL